MSEQMNARWVKSSLSFSNGNCVEAANLPGGEIGVRDSRRPEGPVLRFTPGEWDSLRRPRPARGSRPGQRAYGRMGVFLSVDVDVCDPVHAPGTGTPEPGGPTTRQLLDWSAGSPTSCPWSGSTWWRSPAARPRGDHLLPRQPGRAGGAARQPPGHSLRRRRYPPKPSNSPFRTPPRKARHSSEVNLRTGPDGVPAVANADLATGQARHLDAVAVGVTQGALDPVRT